MIYSVSAVIKQYKIIAGTLVFIKMCGHYKCINLLVSLLSAQKQNWLKNTSVYYLTKFNKNTNNLTLIITS